MPQYLYLIKHGGGTDENTGKPIVSTCFGSLSGTKTRQSIYRSAFHLSVCEPEKAVTFPDGLLFVIKLLCLILRLAGQVHAQFFQSVFVHLREYHAGVHLAAAEQPELFERERSDGIRSRAY